MIDDDCRIFITLNVDKDAHVYLLANQLLSSHRCKVLFLSCQARVTVTSCFVYKVITD